MKKFLDLANLARLNYAARVPQCLNRELSSTSWQRKSAGKKKGTKSGGGPNLSVNNDRGANKFTIDLGNNQQARIDYRTIGHNKLELYYTEVPKELRGRGIGKALARGALEQASKSNTKLKLTCSYLSAYVDKYKDPKYKKLVSK